jgi:hypothetical protein
MQGQRNGQADGGRDAYRFPLLIQIGDLEFHGTAHLKKVPGVVDDCRRDAASTGCAPHANQVEHEAFDPALRLRSAEVLVKRRLPFRREELQRPPLADQFLMRATEPTQGGRVNG